MKIAGKYQVYMYLPNRTDTFYFIFGPIVYKNNTAYRYAIDEDDSTIDLFYYFYAEQNKTDRIKVKNTFRIVELII